MFAWSARVQGGDKEASMGAQVCMSGRPFKDLKWSNVPGVKLSSLSESDDTFPSLQALSNLYYLFSGFMDYLWSCELNISNFGPTDRKFYQRTPCRETISFIYNIVRVSILSVALVGIKCADLESLVVSATNRVSLDPDTSCQNLVDGIL
ncbi:hypothetical protein Tco_1298390 [Tanacetum coccineum]